MKRFTFSLALTLTLALAVIGGLVPVARAQEAAGTAIANPQDPGAVSQAAEDYLRQQLAQMPGDPSIKMDEVRTDHLAACDSLQAYMPGGARPRARMSVGVRCTGPRAWSVFVQATVSLPGQYFVAARMINAGEVITATDVAPRDGDLVNLPPGAMTDMPNIVGMTAANRIAAGQPFKSTALRSPGAVQRGQTVRINARGPGFVVSSEGQAMENAAPGAMVQVRTASGQIVSGVVQSQGTVEIPL